MIRSAIIIVIAVVGCAGCGAATAPAAHAPSDDAVAAPLSLAADARMLVIPAGPYIAGSTADERATAYDASQLGAGQDAARINHWFDREDDRQTRTLPAFRIDETPVTQAQYAEYVATGDALPPGIDEVAWQIQGFVQDYATQVARFVWPDRHPPPGRDAHPVVLVTWAEADRYCRWRGQLRGEPRRLPTADEFEKAARGDHGAVYPWGDVFAADKLDSAVAGPHDTMPVGSFPAGASPYGMLDAAGNVFEWTSAPFADAPGKMTVKGSAWDDFAGVGRGASRHGRPVAARHAIIGFRCASTMATMTESTPPNPTRTSAIIVHGGAGTIAADRESDARAGVRAAAAAGDAILAAGGSALDAVVAAVRVLEDDPQFNAGTGAALTREGRVETDAAVMDGATRRVGAVAAVPDLGRPIAVARAVLEAGEHVLLAGAGALAFAAEHGIMASPQGTLITEPARQRWLAESTRRAAAPGAPAALPGAGSQSGNTVGAVARDHRGGFAAATSTGGIVWKRSGRIGDSPIPGAGTWADDHAAISATGDGEAVLRVGLARGIASRVAAGRELRTAAVVELRELARLTGGLAGMIGVDARGVVGVQLTASMPIAWCVRGGAGAADDVGDSLGEHLP